MNNAKRFAIASLLAVSGCATSNLQEQSGTRELVSLLGKDAVLIDSELKRLEETNDFRDKLDAMIVDAGEGAGTTGAIAFGSGLALTSLSLFCGPAVAVCAVGIGASLGVGAATGAATLYLQDLEADLKAIRTEIISVHRSYPINPGYYYFSELGLCPTQVNIDRVKDATKDDEALEAVLESVGIFEPKKLPEETLERCAKIRAIIEKDPKAYITTSIGYVFFANR